MNNEETEINERLCEELDNQFPKGDEARGRALVLFAIAQLEINNARKDGKKIIVNVLDHWLENCITNIDKRIWEDIKVTEKLEEK